MSNGANEQLKRFVFTSKYNQKGEAQEERLEIVIPEVQCEIGAYPYSLHNFTIILTR